MAGWLVGWMAGWPFDRLRTALVGRVGTAEVGSGWPVAPVGEIGAGVGEELCDGFASKAGG